MNYLEIIPNPFFFDPAAIQHSGAAVQAAEVPPPTSAAVYSFADELAELERLIEANNASCEDDPPLFLRRSA
jgi:hypothetical protein